MGSEMCIRDSNEYREKKANVRELQTVKSNLDKILRREPERGKGQENER